MLYKNPVSLYYFILKLILTCNDNINLICNDMYDTTVFFSYSVMTLIENNISNFFRSCATCSEIILYTPVSIMPLFR